MKMDDRNFTQELKSLKEEIVKLVGEERINKINKLIEISYKFDEKPKYKTEYKIKD